MRFLFGLFILLPILEMWLLIEVGGVIGALPTIALVLLTAVIGAALLKQQGLHTFMRAQQRLNTGELPATEILEGLFLAVGGALLLTPGFITDAIGFSCLLPSWRRAVIAGMMRRGVIRMQSGMGGGSPFGADPRPGREASPPRDADNVTIEGEYKKEED